MDHFVALDRLPEGLEFPPDLRDRIQFEPETHRLVYHGFMSKADFDRLSKLSEDWTFLRTLEDLFRECGPEGDAGSPRWRQTLQSALGLLGFRRG